MPTLVSIISEQTLPNLLLIKELKGQYDKCLFITTDLMEGNGDQSKSRSRWIERAAGIPEGSVERIIVSEDNWDDIQHKLEQFVNRSDKFIVNLTGGTKVMTLVIYSFFAKPGNKIIYATIGKNNYTELYPSHTVNPKIINYCVSLCEYLWCYGLFFNMTSEFKYSVTDTKAFFNSAKRKQFSIDEIAEIKNAHFLTNEKDKKYYSGGWFEEYTYAIFKEQLKIRNDRIAMNVELYRNPDDNNNDNEFDLMFIEKNQLYVIECKMSLGKNTRLKENIKESLYKLGAVTRDFGLKVNSYLITLSDLRDEKGEINDSYEKRRKILGIKTIIDRTFFLKEQSISSIINKQQ